jgi:hypothetical protein
LQRRRAVEKGLQRTRAALALVLGGYWPSDDQLRVFEVAPDGERFIEVVVVVE